MEVHSSAMRNAGTSDESASGSALTPQASPALEGELEIRVRYCECDPMRVAHHASYIVWMEMGRTELLRPSGISYRDMETAGVFLAVARLNMQYRAPIFYDDLLLLRTRVSGGGRARIDHVYEFYRREAGRPLTSPLATAESTLACVDAEGRARALPDWLAPARRAARR